MPADPQPSQEPGPRNQLIPPSVRSAYDERYGIGLHAKSLNPAPMAQGASTAAFHCKSGTSASRPKQRFSYLRLDVESDGVALDPVRLLGFGGLGSLECGHQCVEVRHV